MKRSIVFALAIALLGACSTKEIDTQTLTQDDVVFYTFFEQPVAPETKVYVNEDLHLRWTADDRVSIFNKNTGNQQFRFTGETGDNIGEFSKVEEDDDVTGSPLSNVVSVYPYLPNTEISEAGVLTVTLPYEQIYAENSFGQDANTMVAVASDNMLQYKNVCGYLRISLFGEGRSIDCVELRGNNDEQIAGTASITMQPGGLPTVEMSEDADQAVILSFETSLELGSSAAESIDLWFVIPPVTFSKGFTISVIQTNGEFFETSTSKSITIERNKLLKMSPVEVETTIIPTLPVPESVDLGLSVKWASCNLGASSPEDFGIYYMWGETEPNEYKGSTTNLSYKWYDHNPNGGWVIKYCDNPNFGSNGFVDGKTVLDLEDDAAHVKLGGKWRMPTADEITELTRRCTWEWVSLNGVYGAKVSSKGMSIFIPAAGQRRTRDWYYGQGFKGNYWSRTLGNSPMNACCLDFEESNTGNGGFNGVKPDFDRTWALPIRPVYAE